VNAQLWLPFTLQKLASPLALLDGSVNPHVPGPGFASRVLKARMLIAASGKRFVWDEARSRFVLAAKAQTDETRSQGALKNGEGE